MKQGKKSTFASSNESKDPAPKLAYIANSFPSLTQTFVYREISALEDLGMNIRTFAIWKKDKDEQSEEARHYVDRTIYVFPLNWPHFFWSHLYFIIKFPWRYFVTLLFVLSRKAESPKKRIRTFFHFCEAVYLGKKMRRLSIVHIHAHFSINAATIALVISRLLRITFSFTAHNILFSDRLLLKEKVREAEFVAAISEYTEKFLGDRIQEENYQDKIHIVHCGLDPDQLKPVSDKQQNEIPVILFVSQLVEKKGAPFLIDACRIMRDRKLDFRCIIIGDGPQKPMLVDMVGKLDLEDYVRLEGRLFQEQLHDYYNRADVFVLPCIQLESGEMDGIPVVLMEAMAMEIPVVSTPISGIPDLIEDNNSGLLVESKNSTALAEAIHNLCSNPELRKKIGRKGREKVVSEFNIKASAEKMKALFERVIQHDE